MLSGCFQQKSLPPHTAPKNTTLVTRIKSPRVDLFPLRDKERTKPYTVVRGCRNAQEENSLTGQRKAAFKEGTTAPELKHDTLQEERKSAICPALLQGAPGQMCAVVRVVFMGSTDCNRCQTDSQTKPPCCCLSPDSSIQVFCFVLFCFLFLGK
jgi:hypothetical protein|uniref:Uncharacterized protein n=1 Tax=Mus musculus TaxID=10090 RepID=Q8C8A0_MOUSE|nr:RIKEN cDNA C130023O10 gene [Mus musculus]AAI47131.1 RIKEN cDNA C130023O10 gene [Mus musculus]BAC33201.1 unnamed protein product [Mus musculus]